MKYKYDPDTGILYGRGCKAIGSVSNTGYLMVEINKKHRTLHRFIFELQGIEIPEGMQVDHINGIKTDNRWDNLRLVSPRDNAKNRATSTLNTSGTIGVCWHKANNRWFAQIHVDGHKTYLGSFVEFSDAVNARKNAEVLYGYHENHGRFNNNNDTI